MIKKRKIKVPKAVNGLETQSSNWQQKLTNELLGNKLATLNTNLGNAASRMRLKADMLTGDPLGAQRFMSNYTGAVDIPTSVNMNDLASAVTTGIGAITDFASPSNVTTGREATVQSLADVGKGIGTGMQIGSMFGPMGAGIGAAAGAVVGAIGKKGKEAEMTSFTDYNEGTLGTGLIGAFSNRKLRRRRAEVKRNALMNKAAVAGTEYLQNEYAEDNTNYNTNTFAEGGIIPSSLAYVDDGELISTPDGQVSKVPEQGQPVDSNLVSLPEGSRILSNTLKVPDTKKTFAELGEEMMTKRKSKGKDRFAENANRLNELNNKQIHDQLFAQQEAIKAKKGSKKEYKNLVEEFQTGGEKRKYKMIYNPITQNFDQVPIDQVVNTENNSDYWYDVNGNRPYTFPFANQQYSELYMGPVWPTRIKSESLDPVSVPETLQVPERTQTVEPAKSTKPTRTSTTTTTYRPPVAPIIEEPSLIEENYEIEPTYIAPATRTTTVRPIVNNNNNEDTTPRRIDWQGALSDIASLTPIMSNLFSGKPERVLANYNPYVSAISNALSRRRFDITPAIQDLSRSRSANDYNASQLNTNTGANLAYRLQSAIAQNNVIANLRAAENNVNNQYRAEYANMMNNLGQQFVAANNLADDLNAQNRASARNLRRAGLSQLSGWAQNRTLMNNQRERDRAMLKLYQPLLEYGFTPQDYNYLLNSLK